MTDDIAYIDATFFAQVERERTYRRAKVVALTQKRPNPQRGGTVLVKLTIRVPESCFLPLSPEAIVVIPEYMTVTEPIEVVAEEP